MANVKLLLLEDVEHLGPAGKEIVVSPGYARNYLLPKGKAARITPQAQKVLAARMERIEMQRKQEVESIESLAGKIAGMEISIAMHASDDDQLFGSVNARNIAEKLAENGIEVEYQRIRLDEPIKALGVYDVDIKLAHDIDAKLKVWVVRD